MTLNLAMFRRQYAQNAAQLSEMLAKAEAVAPKRYRGYDVAELTRVVALFTRLSTATDSDLRDHLRESMERIRTRAQER